MSSLSYIRLLVVESSEKLRLVSNMGASFTVGLACILRLAPQMKVNKRADHLAAQCRRNKLINGLDSALDTLPYTIAVSQKCKFAHPCCHMLLTANAGILCVNIYRQEEAADDNDNGNCPVSHILHMIIHFSVPSLIFLFCYPLALVIVRNQSDFPCKDIFTAKNTYKPLPSLIFFLISMDINHLLNPCPATAPPSSIVEDLQPECQLPPISELFADSTPTGLSTHSQLHIKLLK